MADGKQRSLRKLLDSRLAREEIPRFVAEMQGMHDRAVGVLAATLVEDALEHLMLARMTKLTRDEYQALFQGTSPLSTFSARIRVSRAFKVIGKAQMLDMALIKDIRNVFAHSRLPISFQTREISERVQKIGIIKTFIQAGALLKMMGNDLAEEANFASFDQRDPRIRYILSCALYDQMLRLSPHDPDFDEDE